MRIDTGGEPGVYRCPCCGREVPPWEPVYERDDGTKSCYLCTVVGTAEELLEQEIREEAI